MMFQPNLPSPSALAADGPDRERITDLGGN